jgi:ppGpp synthetase/RelA/SpoT-type nucleotidyltranferase
MNLDEYEREGARRYEVLATTIARIVETVVEQQSGYRVQQVQSRAKEVKSLAKKLVDRGVEPASDITENIKDLAGCRVILYTNSDVARFIQSGVISENFEVDWTRTKFHYPLNEPTAEDGFISYNYVVSLKADRLALPEYRRLAGLRCEIQVQTSLDHAWSEMAHDTIYKPPAPNFGSRIMESVKGRMTEIIQKYLRPAGFEFQKIATDVRALEEGREFFELDPLKLIAEAKDNNERIRLLDAFEEKVLPNLDSLPEVAPKIRMAMVAVVKAARSTLPKPFEVDGLEFGKGYEAHFVVDKALEVIDHIRFQSLDDVDATFQAICDLFGEASDREHDRLLKSLNHLATHDLKIWQAAGPVVEDRLIKQIEALPAEGRAKLFPVVIKTLRCLLEPDVSGTTSTYSQLTIHTTGVVPSEAYLGIRRAAIAVLKDMFASTTDEGDLRDILNAFATAGRVPSHSDVTQALLHAIYSDSIGIVEFVAKRAPDLPYEILQAYEHDLLWRYRHSDDLPPPYRGDEKLEQLRKQFRATILSYRDEIHSDLEFDIYNLLVGFEAVLSPSWAADPFDLESEQAYRSSEIARLAASVTSDTFNVWLDRIQRCAQTRSNDGATFPPFTEFLAHLSRNQPELGMRLLGHLDDDLERFTHAILKGLEDGPQSAAMHAVLGEWIAEGKHLFQIVAHLHATNPLNLAELEAAYIAAVPKQDAQTVALVMEICVLRSEQAPEALASTFTRALKFFEVRKLASWV